jgi:predicted nucleic acid-binding protein
VSFLLDTDTCSAHLKGDSRVFTRLIQHSGGLHVSVLSLCELYSWVLRRNAPQRRLESLEQMISDMRVVEVDATVARNGGELRADMLDRGKPIATVDLLIAATAITHDLTVVTHNVKHFADVPGLRVQDWLA